MQYLRRELLDGVASAEPRGCLLQRLRFNRYERVLSSGPSRWSFFGKNLILGDFGTRPDIRGLGMIDWPGYADKLAEKVSY